MIGSIRVNGKDLSSDVDGIVVIGRDPSSDVVLAHPGVSRRHAVLRRTSGGWVLVDAGSTNGVFLNGDRVYEVSVTDTITVMLGGASDGAPLRLEPPAFAPPTSPRAGPPAWSPTHAAPEGGMSAWSQPDATLSAAIRLADGVPLRVVETAGDWARVEYSNGWTGWVDKRLLVSVSPDAAARPGPARGTGIIGPLGAAAALAGSFLPWFSSGDASLSGWDLPIESLITHQQSFGVATGLLLLPVLIVLLPFATRRPLPIWASVVIASVPLSVGALVLKLWLRMNPRPALGIGVVLVVAGAIAIATGAVLVGRARPPDDQQAP
jgi:hypothetical protein